MDYIPLTIPYSLKIVSKDNWKQLNKKKTKFCLVRFHFALRKKQVNAGPFLGEVVAAHAAPKGVMTEDLTKTSSKQKFTNLTKTLTKALSSHSVVNDIASKLMAEQEFGNIAKTHFELKNEIKLALQHDFEETLETSKLYEYESEITQEYKIHNIAEETQNVFSVKAYKQSSYELWLGFIDYLFVDYKTTHYGLRKKRKKKPFFDNRRRNIMALKEPIAKITFWDLIQDKLYLIDKDKYQLEVDDPKEILLDSLNTPHTPYLKLDDVPSLYRISNVTFPIKWIKIDGELNEDVLKNIELEEAKETESAWWFQYGVSVNGEKQKSL